MLSKKLADGLKSVIPSLQKLQSFTLHPKYIIKISQEDTRLTQLISKIPHFVNHHLQPLVREIPLYIKAANDFINKTNNFPVPPNSLVITMYVKSQYTSIPNNEGIASVTKKL